MNDFLLSKYTKFIANPFKESRETLQKMLDDFDPKDHRADKLVKTLLTNFIHYSLKDSKKKLSSITPLTHLHIPKYSSVDNFRNGGGGMVLSDKDFALLRDLGALGLRLTARGGYAVKPERILAALENVHEYSNKEVDIKNLAHNLVKYWGPHGNIPLKFESQPDLIVNEHLLRKMEEALLDYHSSAIEAEKVISNPTNPTNPIHSLDRVRQYTNYTFRRQVWYASYVMRALELNLITEWEKPFIVKQVKPRQSTILKTWLEHRDETGWCQYNKLGDSSSIGKQLSMQVYAGYAITKIEPGKTVKGKPQDVRYVKFLSWLEDDAPRVRGVRAEVNDKRVVKLNIYPPQSWNINASGKIKTAVKNSVMRSGGEPVFLKLWHSMPDHMASIGNLATQFALTKEGAKQKDTIKSAAYYVARAIKRGEAAVILDGKVVNQNE